MRLPARPSCRSVAQRRYFLGGRKSPSAALAPGLHIVATPIGNLGDMTLRALAALAGVDLIACEDTRVTRKLLDRYGITTPMTPYHDHNAAAARQEIMERLDDGEALALVSDAGTPLVSEPGFKLVRAVIEAGHSVRALPGASAAMAALALTGLPTDRFHFEGFLPPREAARQPHRRTCRREGHAGALRDGAADAATLPTYWAGSARATPLCREMTKLYEEVRRGELAGWRKERRRPKPRIRRGGRPPPAAEGAERVADDRALLREALAAHRSTTRSAAAGAPGQKRRVVYQRALELAKEGRSAMPLRSIRSRGRSAARRLAPDRRFRPACRWRSGPPRC